MAHDTKVFQDIADSMLPLFDNMPQVVVLVEDNEWLYREPYPAGIYSHPNIVIHPSYARTCSYDEIRDLICHELIHAWLHWKGLVGTGDHLDEHHSELFVQKALEINRKKIDNLNVDVDYLLGTTEAVNIYNRVADIQFAPHLRHKVRKIWKTVVAYTGEFVKGVLEVVFGHDPFTKVVVGSFSVVLIGLLLNKTRFIPDTAASFVWVAWSVCMLVVLAVLIIRRRMQ